MTISIRILALTVCVFLTSVFVPSAHAQLRNPGFDGAGFVANGWSPWHYQFNTTADCADAVSYHQPTWSIETNSDLRRSGATSQRIGIRRNLFSAGVVQVDVPVEANALYRFDVFVRGHVSDVPYPGLPDWNVPLAVSAGINPDGGNQTTNDVVTFGAPVNPNGQWRLARVQAVSSDRGLISLVVSAQVGNAPNQCREFVDVWMDEASLIKLASYSAPAPAGRPDPATTPRPNVSDDASPTPSGRWPTVTPWWSTNTPPPATSTDEPTVIATGTGTVDAAEIDDEIELTAEAIIADLTRAARSTASASGATGTVTPTPLRITTITPTVRPTEPIETPTVRPTVELTDTPTVEPTDTPTETPTPTDTPTVEPTETSTPTETPTITPTVEPTETSTPTEAPTITPTVEPTETSTPTETPTIAPTIPTDTPTITPTVEPTETPIPPTAEPTDTPTIMPTVAPIPTVIPVSPTPIATPDGTATICVNTFFDLNADGRRAADEGYIAGIAIELEQNRELIGEQSTTGTAETVCFAGLAADTYKIREILPSILRPTTADTLELVLLEGQSVAIEFGSRVEGREESGDETEEAGTVIETETADITSPTAVNTATPPPRTGGNMNDNSLPILIAGIVVATLGIACTMLLVSRWT